MSYCNFQKNIVFLLSETFFTLTNSEDPDEIQHSDSQLFQKFQMEKFGKTPNFSGKHPFYSSFQNPSENSVIHYL